LYSADGYQDTFDQAVRIQGSATAPSWDFDLSHAMSIASSPLVETGRQTDQTIHSTGANATWEATAKDSLSFALSQSLRFAEGSPDALSWSNQNWYNRALTEAISAGLGVGVGYDLLDPGTDMFSERLHGKIAGSLGRKVTYSIIGGAELRQFVESDAPTKVSPLVSATLTYQILRKTSLFIGFDHSIDTSYFTDQFTQNSSVNGVLTQILSDRWTASASASFRASDYLSTLAEAPSIRTDNTVFASVSLSWKILRQLSVTLSYSFRSNSSDQQSFDFDSHQLGFRIFYAI